MAERGYELRFLEHLVRQGYAEPSLLDAAAHSLQEADFRDLSGPLAPHLEECALQIPDEVLQHSLDSIFTKTGLSGFFISPHIVKRNREVCIPLALDGAKGDLEARESYVARRLIQFCFLEPWAQSHWEQTIRLALQRLDTDNRGGDSSASFRAKGKMINAFSIDQITALLPVNWFLTARMVQLAAERADSVSKDYAGPVYPAFSQDPVNVAIRRLFPLSTELVLKGFIVADLMLATGLPLDAIDCTMICFESDA